MPKETAGGGRACLQGEEVGRKREGGDSHEEAVLTTLKLRRGLPTLAGEAGWHGLPKSAGDEGRLRFAPGDSDPSVGVKRLDRLGGIGGGPHWVGEGVLEPAASMAAIALKP